MDSNRAGDLGEFRREAANWLNDELHGAFGILRNQTSHTAYVDERREWERALGKAGWSAIGWPAEYGGRSATIAQRVAFAEEYARAGAPPRLGHLSVELIGPTLIDLGTEDQRRRFLPEILSGAAVWCQGYSEPGAGSDLANIRTSARRHGDVYIVDGQKIWTSYGMMADWCFLIARTERGSKGPRGLSFLLIDMHQPGVTVRPIRQMTGESEFAEVFYDSAVARVIDRVGDEGDGWAVAMRLLEYERGASTLAQQMHFRNELDQIIAAAKARGLDRDPLIRQRIAQAHAGLKIMRFNGLRMLAESSDALNPAALTYKLYWSHWHQSLGELAMDVLGQDAEVGIDDHCFAALPQMYLMSRSETIYAGTSQVQRNLIAERALGLPREPRG